MSLFSQSFFKHSKKSNYKKASKIIKMCFFFVVLVDGRTSLNLKFNIFKNSNIQRNVCL